MTTNCISHNYLDRLPCWEVYNCQDRDRRNVPCRALQLINPRLALEDQRQDIETEVLDELRNRVKRLLAVWAARHNNAFPTWR